MLDVLGIVGLTAVPAVLALHWLRRRYRPLQVSALFLFADADRSPVVGPQRDRLRSSASFWLELAAAAIFSTLLLLDRTFDAATHHVLVVDGSTALQARVGRESTAERIAAAIRARVGADDRVTLIESGSPPSMLLGPAATAADLDGALSKWIPWRPRHSLDAAIDFARGLAYGGRVTVFSDRLDPAAPGLPEVEHAALGRAVPNIGVIAAQRTAGDEPGVESIELTLANFALEGAAPLTRSFETRVGAATAARESLTLDPGERRVLRFSFRDRNDESFEFALDGDAFRVDDRVVLAPRRRDALRLFTSLDARVERELGMRRHGGEPLDRLVDLLAPALVVTDPATADFALGVQPRERGGGVDLVLPLANPDAKGERRDLVGPFLVDRGDALCDGLAFENVIWSVDPTLVVPGAPLVTAGNLPLLALDDDGARVTLHLAYDPLRSNVHLAPDWPILLTNAAERARAAAPGLRRTNLALGETLEWRASDVATPHLVTLEPAGGTPRAIECRGALAVPAPAPSGLFTLRARGETGSETTASFAVNLLDPHLSDLRGAGEGVRTSALAESQTDAPETWTSALLAMLLLALVLADAFVLVPRRASGIATSGSAS